MEHFSLKFRFTNFESLTRGERTAPFAQNNKKMTQQLLFILFFLANIRLYNCFLLFLKFK